MENINRLKSDKIIYISIVFLYCTLFNEIKALGGSPHKHRNVYLSSHG